MGYWIISLFQEVWIWTWIIDSGLVKRVANINAHRFIVNRSGFMPLKILPDVIWLAPWIQGK